LLGVGGVCFTRAFALLFELGGARSLRAQTLLRLFILLVRFGVGLVSQQRERR
jgi:hypothetical protein